MRDALQHLLQNTVTLAYTLPNVAAGIPKVTVSNAPDECIKKLTTDQDIAALIYNGIVEYSFEENQFDLSKLDKLQIQALASRLKYNPDAATQTQLGYGFYGEVLLYLFLQYFHNVGTVISRGLLYNILENGETKGYDTYQVIVTGIGDIELWFGEVKFRGSYYSSLKEIFEKLDVALSDGYFKDNVLAFNNHFEQIENENVKELIRDWRENPDINIVDEAVKRKFTFVYPVLVVFDDNGKNFDDIINQIVAYINEKYPSFSLHFSLSYKLFFMLLPVSKAIDIKQQVLKWISARQPLI